MLSSLHSPFPLLFTRVICPDLAAFSVSSRSWPTHPQRSLPLPVVIAHSTRRFCLWLLFPVIGLHNSACTCIFSLSLCSPYLYLPSLWVGVCCVFLLSITLYYHPYWEYMWFLPCQYQKYVMESTGKVISITWGSQVWVTELKSVNSQARKLKIYTN